MNINYIDFEGNEMMEVIKRYGEIYYILTFDDEKNEYTVLRLDLKNKFSEKLFTFDDFVQCKVDIKTDILYISGKRNDYLITYMIRGEKSSFYLKLDIRRVNNVLDFFVFNDYLFFLFQTGGYKKTIGYLYHKKHGFLRIRDKMFLNSINTPLFLMKDKDYMLIEEFYIKDFDFSMFLFDDKDFDDSILVNKIYYIEFEIFIKNILFNFEQKYNILRSNKGLNYITILGESNNNVILFEKREDEDNLFLEIDIQNEEVVREIKTKMFFIEQRSCLNEKYFIAYDYDDAQVIFDSKLNQVFKWDRGILNSYFHFCLLYKERFVIFKHYNEIKNICVYNIFDTIDHTSICTDANFLILDDDCIL